MSTVIQHELNNWLTQIDKSQLDNYDKTLINIIFENLNDIETMGTAGGKRVKLISSLIMEKKQKMDDDILPISEADTDSSNQIKKIESISLKSFRGFTESRKFDLSKQYTFFYGPNGSGKSSLTEALEYGLLGMIEEADVRKIKANQYIRNSVTGKGNLPDIRCCYSDGEHSTAKANYEVYRFAFIEKNRIDRFSHIDAASEKSHKESIAALFGLASFNTFVDEFTDSFDNRYILLEPKQRKEFDTLTADNNGRINRGKEIRKSLTSLTLKCNEEIQKLKNADIKTMDQALEYLNNSTTGLLPSLYQRKKENTVPSIDVKLYKKFMPFVAAIIGAIDKIREDKIELVNSAMEVSYHDLYMAIDKLKVGDVCPACQTPLTEVHVNPFNNAKTQLENLKHIDSIKSEINNCARDATDNYHRVKIFLDSNSPLVNLFKFDILNLISHIETKDFIKLGDNITLIQKSLYAMQTVLNDTASVESMIEKYNIKAAQKNTQYDEKIRKLSDIAKNTQLFKTQIETLGAEQRKLSREIIGFAIKHKTRLEKIKQEEMTIKFNQKMVEAYNKFHESITDYRDNLPVNMAKDLASTVLKYYNIINCDDAAFELMTDISLPTAIDEKIIIKFKDGVEADALQVLSEGHIKILGLSILLAKATKSGMNFLIFDDIVNAIDDDHRDGVAELIMKCDDFQDTQIILTCHGEQFLMKLEDKADREKNKDIIRYMFLPADSLEERGIIAEYTDAKTPLAIAQDKYKHNKLKDAASKCRQATECITNNLWKKISGCGDPLSVAMRGPKAIPDLKSVVDGLIKHCNKIDGEETIVALLRELSEKYNWMLLNKGTHFECEQQEFERTDIDKLISILKKLDKSVDGFRVGLIQKS